MPPYQSEGQQTTWRWRTDPTITFENRSPLATGKPMMLKAQPRGVANRAAFIILM